MNPPAPIRGSCPSSRVGMKWLVSLGFRPLVRIFLERVLVGTKCGCAAPRRPYQSLRTCLQKYGHTYYSADLALASTAQLGTHAARQERPFGRCFELRHGDRKSVVWGKRVSER